MHKRIKQLLNEATSGHEQETDRSKVMTVSDREMEIFAQLIVRECADIVSDTAVDTPPNDLFYGYNLGVNKAAENIKERFEIEK